MEKLNYVSPRIVDYGTLADLTASCIGTGNQDEAAKFSVILRSVPILDPATGKFVCGVGSPPSDINLKRDIRPL
jgi:hypothetical protein